MSFRASCRACALYCFQSSMLSPTAPHRRRTPPQHSHHVLTHRRGGPRRSARFRYAARGGHLSFCLPCHYSTHHSSIGRHRVRHTANRPSAHSPGLRGRMIGIKHANEKPARRRRLSELLQWQLLMRGAPHISGTAGLLLPRPLTADCRLVLRARRVHRPDTPRRAQLTLTSPVRCRLTRLVYWLCTHWPQHRR